MIPGTDKAFYWCAGVFIAAVLCFTLFSTPAAVPASFSVKIDVGEDHGSGTHIGNGYVITAAHVVDGRTPKVVTDTGATNDAEVLWSNKGYDVAMLRIKDFAGIESAPLSCSSLAPGTYYVAYGNPGNIEFVHAAGEVVGKREPRGDWLDVVTVNGTVVMGMSGGGVIVNGRLSGVTVGVQAVALGPFPSLTGFGFVVPGSAICGLLAR